MRTRFPTSICPANPAYKGLTIQQNGGKHKCKGALPFEYVSGTYIRQS
jgi:hypothetical protein